MWVFYGEFNACFGSPVGEVTYYSIRLLEERVKLFEGVMVRVGNWLC